MKKKIIALFMMLAISLSSMGCSSTKANNVSAESNEPTKTVYLCSSKVIQYDDNYTTVSYKYDPQGKLLENCVRYSFWDPMWSFATQFYSYSYTYMNTNDIKQIIIEEDGLVSMFNYFYSDGKIGGYHSSAGAHAGIRTYFYYDKRGNLIRGEIEDKDGNRATTTEITYWDNGAKKEQTDCYYHYLEEGIVGSSILKKYNENGQLIESIETQYVTPSGVINHQTFKTYNNDGRVATEKIEQYDDISYTEYLYDKDGRLCGEIHELNGEKSYIEGIWDDAGNSMAFYDGDTITRAMIYDEANNMVSDMYYVDGKLSSTTDYTYIALELPIDYVAPDLSDLTYLVDRIA